MRLGCAERSQLFRCWGEAESFEDSLDIGNTHGAWGGQFDSDRPAIGRVIDEQAGYWLLDTLGPISRLPREVNIGSEELPFAIRHLHRERHERMHRTLKEETGLLRLARRVRLPHHGREKSHQEAPLNCHPGPQNVLLPTSRVFRPLLLGSAR